MSKHQQPTHSYFSKRTRLDTSPSDAADEHQVSVAPKSAPNDISKTMRDGPTQMELFKCPADANERRFRKEWFKDCVWLEWNTDIMLHDETLHDITLQTECYLDKMLHDRMLLGQNVTRQNGTNGYVNITV